jgi:hypothetical protein
MQSEEGLFFESSATVPYHFLNQAEMSQSPSEAMRSLPYQSLNVSDAIPKMQALGVKYYLAVSPEAVQQADADPRLTRVDSTPAKDGQNQAGQTVARNWVAYEINDSALVAPLNYLPAVMTNQKSITTRRDGKDPAKEPLSDREAWLENSLSYYQNDANYDVPFAASGPGNWPRVTNALQTPQRVPVTDPARVTQISTGDDRISFHVDNLGSPVVVRASYFPDWQVTGGKGPYRITPNLMVVIPTSNYVELHYGRSGVDWLGISFTLLGFIGVGWLVRGDRRVEDTPLPPEQYAVVEPLPEPPVETPEEEPEPALSGAPPPE